jgi:hypothetical protein
MQNLDSFKRPHLMAYKAACFPPLGQEITAAKVLDHHDQSTDFLNADSSELQQQLNNFLYLMIESTDR